MRRKHIPHCKHQLPVHDKKPSPFNHAGMIVVLVAIVAVSSIAALIVLNTESRTSGKAIDLGQGLSLFPAPFTAQGVPNTRIIIPDRPDFNERSAANKLFQFLSAGATPCVPDNCPTISNSNQSDSDNDTIGDVCDNCKNISNTSQEDTDKDNIGNSCDNCPTIANTNQQDTNRNSVGDACEPFVCPTNFIRINSSTCVQCVNNSQCSQTQTCQNNQCGTVCESTGVRTVFQNTFTTLSNFTPITGIWSIADNKVVTSDGTLVKVLKSPHSGSMTSVSTTFTDQNNQAFIIFITNQNTVIAAGIRTATQKQVVLEQWVPGQTTTSITASAQGILPFLTPGTHTLKVKFSPTTVQILIDCQAFLNVSTTALNSVIGTGIGIASGNGSFQEFTIQTSCESGGFIPTGSSVVKITGAQVVNPDPDNDGIPSTCGRDQTILKESEINNIFQKNNIIIGTLQNNELVKIYSGKKVLKGYTQIELQQQQGNAWLLLNGGTSEDILSASIALQNTAGFNLQGQSACIKTSPNRPVFQGTTCPTCPDCQQNQICTNQQQLAVCKDTDNDGCPEQLFEQCTFECSNGKCNTAPRQAGCIESWVCDQFTSCQNDKQTRTCTDQNKCNTDLTKPVTEKTCSCTEQWECRPFTDCSAGIQTRYCFDTAECGTETTKPLTQQSCASCNDNTQNQGEQGIDCGGPCDKQCAHIEKPQIPISKLPVIWWSVFAFVLAIVLITSAVLINHHMKTISYARNNKELPEEYLNKLVNYIQKDLRLGFTRNAIEQALLNEGWSRNHIEEGFALIASTHHQEQAQQIIRSANQENRNRPKL